MGCKRWNFHVVASLILLATGCGGEDPVPTESTDPHPLEACAATPTSPESITETLEALELLPEPTIPCLVASLERPLEVVASRSQFSAQPALDEDNPRIFLLREGLVLTVVTAGFGQELLEFGEWQSPTRTLKAELEFPVSLPIPASAPFEQVLLDSDTVTGIATGCAVCHGAEEATVEVDGVNGYSSVAYRPLHDLIVPWAQVEAERDRCSPDDVSARCEMFRALVDFGATESRFDEAVPTFTD